ncbi:tetratricopeptide repeat protein [Fluviispira multicolorata]|uniref:Tetratricopeptide repeat protein n=1 Tax=Fluviispira multicolorata TaxID=2654512 RepID=A0A833JBR7_9BACT|nr:tetratricopeptide repeat protein [Fluviispira multicolorata]KAB8029113.1 tetratricopeptide repeat protein [Fluviispira multicolorata]
MIKKTFVNLIFPLVAIFLLYGCSSSKISSDSLNYIISGNKFAEKGDFQNSATQYKLALKAEPNSTTAKRNLGLVSVKIGKFKEAALLLLDISEYYPKDSELFYFLGEANRGLGFDKEAIKFYQKSLSISPSELRTLKSLSWVYLKTGDYDQAENLIKRNFERNPLDLQLLLISTSIDIKKEKYSKAIKAMQDFEKSDFRIVSKDQTTAETEKILLLNVLGNAYAGVNNCEKAQKIYDIILKLRPFLASTLTDSAKCDLRLNNTFQAKNKLEKAHAAEPNYPEALYLLGKIYTNNDPKKAAFYYKRFVEISSDYKNLEAENKQAQASLNLLESKNLGQGKKSD